MAHGLVDADLGSGLFKKRIARFGSGKRGGFRVIVAKKPGGPWFFVDGFAKGAVANLDPQALESCKLSARLLSAMSGVQRDEAVLRGELKEVNCDA